MSEQKSRYITTTLPYVNADPHIGFAFEVVTADALTRYWRLLEQEVFFNTGADEHGQKIAQKADEKGEDRQAYVNHFAGEFARLKDDLNLSFDNFIRTTDPDHMASVQEMWHRCALNVNEKGESDIYKKKYTGLYCVGCELFYKGSELEEGKVCPIHKTVAQEIAEENYFFRLSRFQSYLEEYLSTPGVVEPEWRRQEAINFVKGGLEDFSISREKSRLDWGVPVPGDEDQVMYVWFDALTNYISTLGWPDESDDFGKFWRDGEVVQLAGKDQVRFQSIMWQAMLKSANVKATDKVVYHGFINSGGQKMSKSIGNVISPYELIAKYGTDATRYLLLRHVHPFDDVDITWDRLDEWYTANLVNGLGNLVARVMKMAETHLEKAGDFDEAEAFKLVSQKAQILVPRHENKLSVRYSTEMDNFLLQDTMDLVWAHIQLMDEDIAIKEPFKVIKVNPDEGKKIINELRSGLTEVALLLKPFMPDTSHIILEAIAENKKPENLFARFEA
jgi:methionyl-tRNA synthetase